MALKKYKDLIETKEDTLRQDMTTAQDELGRLRLEHKIKGLQNPSDIRHLRKEIAMMQTELRKREIAQ